MAIGVIFTLVQFQNIWNKLKCLDTITYDLYLLKYEHHII